MASVVPILTTLVIVIFFVFMYKYTSLSLWVCSNIDNRMLLYYPMVPRGHVEEEVIKSGLEWNLESLV